MAAIRKLKSNNFINHERYGVILMEEKGIKRAEELIKKYDLLFDFFKNILNFDNYKADRYACILEHFMDEGDIRQFGDIERFIKKLNKVSKQTKKKIKSLKKKNKKKRKK